MHAADFLLLANALPEALMLLRANGEIIAANAASGKFLGVEHNALPGRMLGDFVTTPADELSRTLRNWSRSRSAVPASLRWKNLPEKSHSWRCQGFMLLPATQNEFAQLILRCIPGMTPASEFLALNRELEKQQTVLRKLLQSREELEREHELALVTLRSIGDAVITTDSKMVVDFLNPIAEMLTGWMSGEAKGRPLLEVFNIVDEITLKPAMNPVERCLQEGRIVGLANHTVLISREGTEYSIEDSAAPIRDRRGLILGVVLVFRDVTSDRMVQRRLEYLAQHDTLTGLNNRHSFEQQLEHVVQLAKRGKQRYALFYIDLDQFKIINDTAGHAAGDGLLKEVAHLFAGRLRQGDTLARLGGDEFGVLLENVAPENLETIAQSYINCLQDFRFGWDGADFDITPSVGVAIIDANTTSAAETLREADIACYVAKRSGRNRHHIYSHDDEAQLDTVGELSVVNELRSALTENNFKLFFQPIVELATGNIVLHEVLLRLQRNSDTSLLAPGSFIPVAERYGLMPMIDLWVVKAAVHLLQEKLQQGKRLPLTINLSGMSFGDTEILKFMREALQQEPNLAGLIMIEVTETAAVRHIDKAIEFMRELGKLGVRFALDDFGTGFSSFAYLKHLPVDYLKIDGTFVRDILVDPVDQAMVRSINHIAHSLGKLTVAEFVENEEMLQYLREIGVDMVQGYHIGRPGPELIEP
ncbi:MAG: EAL domain-containing protein [Gammaproteobacteria bacterium]|nr:EAL domain-containing protein [Gammaproteobacteria bacterium]MDH5653529.1 EAL domain-containing protein [Gammaproteobacteria bacterium]